jgi:hypothetical protein
MPDHTQCPHIDRGDLRCAQRFTLANAVDVFAVCCGGQHGCAIFHRLNMEQAYGTLDEPKPMVRRVAPVATPLTVSADANRRPLRQLGA